MQKQLNKLRVITTVLVCLPACIFVLQIINSLFFHWKSGSAAIWVLAAVLILPFSIIILLIHYYIAKKRKALQLSINETDNLKIFIAIAGCFIGLILWAFMVAMLQR